MSVFIGNLFPIEAALANDLRCAQAFLDFKGYDPGPIDGAFGGRTAAAAEQLSLQGGETPPPLTAANADQWCAMAGRDVGFSTLLNYTYSPSQLRDAGVTSNRNPDQILVGDSVGQFSPAPRNVSNPTALGFIDLANGLAAARVRVRYEDEGHPDDWFWNDNPGVQQRFELEEQRSFSMRPGNTYWLRMSVFIPSSVQVSPRDQLVLSDLKPRVNGAVFDPVLNIKLSDRYLQVDHLVGRIHECVNGFSEDNHENTFCDSSKEQLFLTPLAQIQDRWVNLVYRFHWADDETGRFHLWIDDEFAIGLAGDNVHGADLIQNKFGIYRGFYGSQGEPQSDAAIYFAGVGRSRTCEGLGLDNCATFESDLDRIDTSLVLGRNLVDELSMTEYLATGGRVM